MRRHSILGFFPYGKAPLLLLISTLCAFIYLIIHPIAKTSATLSFWTFAKTHYTAYETLKPSFEEKHPGATVDLQLVHGQAVTTRLQSAFWADLNVPDVVEVEIGFAGTFFRGPPEEIGFIDLKPWLVSSGLYDRMVKQRFAPYSNRGAIYGLPHDVHPVLLAYRRDIFEEEGVDVSEIETWDDFIRLGRELTIKDERYMIQLSDRHHGQLEMFLFQRDGGYFDRDGNLIMDNETAVECLKWYVPLVAGPDPIGNDLGGGQVFTKAVEEGYFLTLPCPDWRSKFIEVDVPRVSGKMALMPLPAAEPGGRRTSTWGGTMLGITKKCSDKELARELAIHMHQNVDQLAEAFRGTNILPPLKDAWTHEAFSEPRPYWSDQKIGELFISVAEDVPPQYTSPFILTAKAKMSESLSSCVSYYNAHGEAGFDEHVRRTLKEAANEVRTYMKRNPF